MKFIISSALFLQIFFINFITPYASAESLTDRICGATTANVAKLIDEIRSAREEINDPSNGLAPIFCSIRYLSDDRRALFFELASHKYVNFSLVHPYSRNPIIAEVLQEHRPPKTDLTEHFKALLRNPRVDLNQIVVDNRIQFDVIGKAFLHKKFDFAELLLDTPRLEVNFISNFGGFAPCKAYNPLMLAMTEPDSVPTEVVEKLFKHPRLDPNVKICGVPLLFLALNTKNLTELRQKRFLDLPGLDFSATEDEFGKGIEYYITAKTYPLVRPLHKLDFNKRYRKCSPGPLDHSSSIEPDLFEQILRDRTVDPALDALGECAENTVIGSLRGNLLTLYVGQLVSKKSFARIPMIDLMLDLYPEAVSSSGVVKNSQSLLMILLKVLRSWQFYELDSDPNAPQMVSETKRLFARVLKLASEDQILQSMFEDYPFASKNEFNAFSRALYDGQYDLARLVAQSGKLRLQPSPKYQLTAMHLFIEGHLASLRKNFGAHFKLDPQEVDEMYEFLLTLATDWNSKPVDHYELSGASNCSMYLFLLWNSNSNSTRHLSKWAKRLRQSKTVDLNQSCYVRAYGFETPLSASIARNLSTEINFLLSNANPSSFGESVLSGFRVALGQAGYSPTEDVNSESLKILLLEILKKDLIELASIQALPFTMVYNDTSIMYQTSIGEDFIFDLYDSHNFDVCFVSNYATIAKYAQERGMSGLSKRLTQLHEVRCNRSLIYSTSVIHESL